MKQKFQNFCWTAAVLALGVASVAAQSQPGYIGNKTGSSYETTITVLATARDFWPCEADGPSALQLANCGERTIDKPPCPSLVCHTDFEGTYSGDDRGIVDVNLDPISRIPSCSSCSSIFEPTSLNHSSLRGVPQKARFDQWYRDTTDVNINIPVFVTLSNDICDVRGPDGKCPGFPFVFAINEVNFYPLDGMGFGNYAYNTRDFPKADGVGTWRNYHFTMESHFKFIYEGGETLDFRGDDDLWVFVANKLVVDLGGVHSSENASLSLDTLKDVTGQPLNLVKGMQYNMDFFYAERHTLGAKFTLTTTIHFVCDWIDKCGVCEGYNYSCDQYFSFASRIQGLGGLLLFLLCYHAVVE